MFALAYLSLMWLESFTSTFDHLSELDHCSPAGVLTCSPRLDFLPVAAVGGPAALNKDPSLVWRHRLCKQQLADVEEAITGMSTMYLFLSYVHTIFFLFVWLFVACILSSVKCFYAVICISQCEITMGLVNLCIKDSSKHVFNMSIFGCGHPFNLEKLLERKKNTNDFRLSNVATSWL